MAYSRALRLAQIARPRTVSLRRVAIFSIESQTEAERLLREWLTVGSFELSVFDLREAIFFKSQSAG
jgi:hypothetical protein